MEEHDWDAKTDKQKLDWLKNVVDRLINDLGHALRQDGEIAQRLSSLEAKVHHIEGDKPL